MLLSKEVDPSDQIVKSLIDQAQMKFQAVNKEHLHKKRDKSRMIEENTVYSSAVSHLRRLRSVRVIA